MKKLNKNLIFSIVFMVILQLVTPLLALAESGNSLRINTNYTDEDSKKEIIVDYVDYWKIPEDKAKDLSDQNKQRDFAKSYEEKSNEEISNDLGEMKSSNKSEEEEKNGMYFAMIDGLEKGVYLLRYRSDDPSRPYIPFLATIDENTENPLTIYPKKAPDTLTLTKRDDQDKKVLPGVGFIVVNEKGETLKFNKIDEKSEKAEFAYEKDGKISEIFTDKDGQIKLSGLTEKVKFKETKPLEGYKKDLVESKFFQKGSIELFNRKEKPENYFSFQKIDGTDNNPLEGAVFKVQEKTKDGYKDLDDNGKVYTLTSGKDGEFKTKNLPYGDYRLIETKAPQGYIPELESINFNISENSHTKKIKIKNYKPTTPGPKGENNRLSKRVDAMAKTGDATIYLILLLGLIMIGCGVKFVRAKE